MWDKSRRKIVISRDVIIEEENSEEQKQVVEYEIMLRLSEKQGEAENNGLETEEVTIRNEEQEQQEEEKMQKEENSHSETENKTEQEKPQLRRSNRIRRPPERYNTAFLI